VRNTLFIFCLWVGIALWTRGAETLTLVDGATLSGDVVKFDDGGLLLRTMGDVYTNLPWARFSQASLKQLGQNPKLRPLVEVFIEPEASQRPAPMEIKITGTVRLERPAQPSIFGGLVKSPVGVFVLLVLYLANLFAGFEVAIFRSRPVAQVVGLSALLPLVGPLVFLALPANAVAESEELSAAGVADAGTGLVEEIQIAEASWKQDPAEKKNNGPQIFTRGRYTFNKRFIETKFAGFMGELKGEAKAFSMEVRTLKEQFSVEIIVRITATEVVFETISCGQIAVPLADIQEITLHPISQ